MTAPLVLMVVGAPKSGSTALLRYLSEHPEVQTHVHPEMPYFARDEEVASGWEFALGKYFSRSSQAPVVAKHTMAMYDPASMQRIAESTSAVVVAVLRDPVRRAYSHFHYARLRGWEDAESFEQGLEREPGRKVSTPRQGRDMQYFGDGVYAPHVRSLLDALPPERRRIYLSDDLRSNPLRVCDELFALAGLPPHHPDVAKGHNEARRPRSARFARAFLAIQRPGSPLRTLASRALPSRALYRGRYLVNRVNESGASLPPVSPGTAARLRQRYVEPNAELADLLGRSLDGWGE